MAVAVHSVSTLCTTAPSSVQSGRCVVSALNASLCVV